MSDPQQLPALRKIAAQQMRRDATIFLRTLDNYLGWAVDNGPGCPSADRWPGEWTSLMDAAQEARYSATQGLLKTVNKLMQSVAEYEQSEPDRHAYWSTAVSNAREKYRLKAIEEIKNMKIGT